MLARRLQHVTPAPDSQKNFLVVDSKTENAAIEAAFQRFTTDRKDIGIVLINQHVSLVLLQHKPTASTAEAQQLTVLPVKIADRIRHTVDTYTAAFPAVLEIPSKDHPYDPEKDSVLRRVRRLFGE